jgi:hypothetical protein
MARTGWLTHPAYAQSSPNRVMGTYRSGTEPRWVPANSRGATPMIVNGRLLTETARPMTSGFAPKRDCHSLWLSIATGPSPMTRRSLPANVRPSAASMPTMRK